MALGAKTAQRLMNSDRDTHLYCSFFTVLFSMPFGCLSNSFIQNCKKFVQFMFQSLNISVFRWFYCSLWLWEIKLAKD